MLCRRRQGRKKRGEERGLPERRNRAPLPLMQIKPERNQQCKRKQVQNNNNGKKLSPGQRQNCEQLTTRKIAKARQTIPRRQKADALLLLSRSFLFLACLPPSRASGRTRVFWCRRLGFSAAAGAPCSQA